MPDQTMMADLFADAERMLRDGPLLRAVNFHHTPAASEAALDRQFAVLARHFAPVDEERLERYCETGEWLGKPGIVLAFYDGRRSNFDVARPLLDRYGLVGWFFVVSGFVSQPAETQAAFAARNRIAAGSASNYPDGRFAMNWDEVRALDGPHVIASHTRSHTDVGAGDPEMLRGEIVGAQDDFRAALGHPVKAIAALRGRPYGENPVADRLIDEAGHRFVISNLKFQRLAYQSGDASAPPSASRMR